MKKDNAEGLSFPDKKKKSLVHHKKEDTAVFVPTS